ncbi:MAG: site-2 protease family protein [Candidatus Aenigmatarchaeota archaeon]
MKLGLLDFKQREIRDIVLSTLVLAFAFSKFYDFLVSLFIISFAFVLHELGHRTAARKFGAFAEYRMWVFGLMLALLTAILPGGIIFAAPGAVYFSPIVKKEFAWGVHRLTRKEIGLISLSGPAINLAMGFIFGALIPALPELVWILYPASRICLLLALFNLLPIAPLDGQKILRWNALAWTAAMAAAVAGYLIIPMQFLL